MDVAKRKSLIGTRFLSFTLDGEAYCIEINIVKELMGMASITPLPQTPEYIRGVINLRGQIIPIVDLRVKFGLEFKPYGKRTSIMVAENDYQGEKSLMGLVVDSIEEVVSIPDENISRISYISAKVKSEYIKGIANTADGIKVLLDVGRVLDDDEMSDLKNAAQKAIQPAEASAKNE